MSCEQLIIKLEDICDPLPDGTEASALAGLIMELGEHCPSMRPFVTHTSRLVNPDKHAELDRVWQEKKKEAKALLGRL